MANQRFGRALNTMRDVQTNRKATIKGGYDRNAGSQQRTRAVSPGGGGSMFPSAPPTLDVPPGPPQRSVDNPDYNRPPMQRSVDLPNYNQPPMGRSVDIPGYDANPANDQLAKVGSMLGGMGGGPGVVGPLNPQPIPGYTPQIAPPNTYDGPMYGQFQKGRAVASPGAGMPGGAPPPFMPGGSPGTIGGALGQMPPQMPGASMPPQIRTPGGRMLQDQLSQQPPPQPSDAVTSWQGQRPLNSVAAPSVPPGPPPLAPGKPLPRPKVPVKRG